MTKEIRLWPFFTSDFGLSPKMKLDFGLFRFLTPKTLQTSAFYLFSIHYAKLQANYTIFGIRMCKIALYFIK
jgi:hypothetical protein